MKFGTIGGRFVVVRDGRSIDVGESSAGHLPSDPLDVFGRWSEIRQWADHADWSFAVEVADRDLGPPVPNPRQVFAIALNYRPHAAEAGFEPPAQPLVFTKFPSCIVGPDVDVRLPAGKVDWEIEVVAIIGAGGRSIHRDHAWGAVAGLTLGQDLSERVMQSAGAPPQFSLGKSHLGFGPIGPIGVTPDEFPDVDDIGFKCLLDDECVQRGRTSEMIFPIDDLVARLSSVCELWPGDLIFTGTPAGVGHRRRPPRYLRTGETLVSTAEHIGRIRQRFLA